MSDSVLVALVNATRPFKPFTCEIGENTFDFYTRRLSAAESAVCNQVYSDEYNKALEELENEGNDLSAMRRTIERQNKEKLIDYILGMDRSEYLTEASSELDDMPFDDARVIARADQLQAEARTLMLGAPDHEIYEKALEKRSYIYAAVRGSNKRNVQIVYFSTYVDRDGKKELAFESPESISDNLDISTIESLLQSLAGALGEQKADPLKSVDKTSSKRRTRSRKDLAAV